MYRGINAISIDAKGRMHVPARYRDALLSEASGGLVVTIDTEETCLLLYPGNQWQLIESKLQSLPSFNSAARRIQRLLIGHATDIEPDSAGRLLIPPLLREYAELDKKVVMIGQGNKFEVWSEQLWLSKRQQWLAEDSSLSEDLPAEMKEISI